MDFKCEPDEFAKLVAEFKAAAIIADNRKGLFVQKNTFLGSQLVMYLTSVKHLSRLLIPLELFWWWWINFWMTSRFLLHS